jgi:hypothetical protein
MTDRYTSFEATAAGYTTDTHTFTANRHDIDVVTEDISPDRGHQYVVTSKGRTPRAKLIGPLGWTGNIETLLYTKHASSLLYYAMGGNSTVVDMPTLGVQQHTLTPATSIPHFIMATGRDLFEHQYVGCVATGFSIDFAPDSPLSANFDINARKELATGTALGTVTYEDFDAAERTFSGVEIASAMGAAEGGAPTADTTIESANISYENNFESDAYVLGDQHLSGKFVNQIELTGSLEFSFLTIGDYDDVVGDVDKELWFTATQGAGAAERGYVIKLPRISYDSTSLPTNNAERYVQSVDFTATDNAAGNNIEIVVTNDMLAAEFIA